MFVASLIVLAAAVIIAALAIYSGHIPWLRTWTGAAPLQAEEDSAATFAASDAAGYVTRPDWGPEPARPRLPEEDPS